MQILITAGPTREPIDDVRFISNRSSGRMGLALAEAATDAGHDVTLLLGPVLAPAALHDRCRVIRFNCSQQLESLLTEHFPPCDLLIMAAAVADYRPLNPAAGKLPREPGRDMMLRLEPTPDLVATAAATKRPDQRIIAFALEEPETLEPRAIAKMQRKRVDAVVANPLLTMEADEIAPLLLHADGRRESPPRTPLTKPDFARWLLTRLPPLFDPPPGPPSRP